MRCITLIAMVASLLVSACAPQPPAGADLPTVEQEVTDFLAEYLSAISSRDAERIRSVYVSDDRLVWIEDGEVRYRRIEDILASLATFPADSPIRTELADLNIVPVGRNGAHAWAPFKTTIGEGARSFSFEGLMSFALESDGIAWKVVGGHVSTPTTR